MGVRAPTEVRRLRLRLRGAEGGGQANAFAEVSNGLYKRDLKNPPFKGSSVPTFEVNASFSIELYLKTIHDVYGNKIRGHHLSIIFSGNSAE